MKTLGWFALTFTLSFVAAQISEPLEALQDALLEITEPQAQAVDEKLSALLKIYGQTLAWHQQQTMERTRMEGDSGLMQTRNTFSGTKPWTSNTWSRENGQAAIHNHANNIRTVGMGEFAAVMNGVEFITRHNDYRLNKASTTSTEYGAYEPVEFPPIPPSVLEKATIEEQIAEMREYFLAFATQNSRHRDYKPYFKPVLSYIQGMWTVPGDTVDEPFFSDRHSLNADTWFQLQQDVMFNTWSGRKDIAENSASLPTMVYGVHDDGTPKIAQWNYKILTHAIQREVPLKRFRVVDDLSLMMRSYKSLEEFAQTRSARFQLHPSISDDFNGLWYDESQIKYENFLEEIMYEVPGLDNYPANIPDVIFNEPPLTRPNQEALNGGYYHRYYSLGTSDASGFTKAARGFADTNLFVALNNQTKVAPILARSCRNWRRNCDYEEVRASYAMPLEILYLTPLNTWNPYDIVFHDNKSIPEINLETGKKRTGRKNTTEDAFNGVTENIYYLTPAEFFEGTELDGDSADTVRDAVYVLDGSGTVRRTVASGMRIFLPNMPGIGAIRTRYPIFNVHQEGSAIYKELSALKDLVRFGSTYAHLYEKPLGGLDTSAPSGLERFTFALSNGKGQHIHTFEITTNEILAMKEGSPDYKVQVETSTTSSHSHTLQLRSKARWGQSGIWIHSCDLSDTYTTLRQCPDGHSSAVTCLDCPLGLLDP